MQPSQNKLHHQLLAGGKTLCTNHLLMVCKLRAEFAPSYILHLSLPFFSLTPQKCIEGPFCPSSSVFKKSCKESRIYNSWIYEAERVSSAHVNYPNICIWVSQWERSPTLLQPNSKFHLADNCQFNQECKFYQYPPSILPLTYADILSRSFVCLNDLLQRKEGGDPFSKCTILTAAPAIAFHLAYRWDQICFSELISEERKRNTGFVQEIFVLLLICVCACIHKPPRCDTIKRIYATFISSLSGFSFPLFLKKVTWFQI